MMQRATAYRIDALRMQISLRRHLMVLATALLLIPGFALAQANHNDDLKATIMAALLTDPRTATVPPAELNMLVNALAEQAKVQGITAQEIKWRPAVSESFLPEPLQEETCDSAFAAFCPFSEAFGFVGHETQVIPAALFVTAALLFLILRRVIKHHRAMLDKQKGVVGSEIKA